MLFINPIIIKPPAVFELQTWFLRSCGFEMMLERTAFTFCIIKQVEISHRISRPDQHRDAFLSRQEENTQKHPLTVYSVEI